MPYKKKNYRRRKRRYKKKGKSMFQKSTSMPLSKKFTFKTRYFESALSVNPAVGGLASSYVFRGNSLFDPNLTGVGHQPIGFDQLMPLYDHYTVIGMRARVEFTNTDLVRTNQVGIYISDQSAVEPDPRVIIENGLGKHTLLNPHDSGGNSHSTLTLTHSPHKFLTRPNPLSDDALRGTILTNPAEGTYLHVWAADPAGADSALVNFQITLEYIAILTEPAQLTLS